MKLFKKCVFFTFVFISIFTMQLFAKKKHKSQKIESVSMTRTPCYGKCPSYTVVLNKDGNVIFTGKRFTQDTGMFTKNIGVDKVKNVFNKIMEYRVDTCNDNYRNRIVDLPGIIFDIKYTKSKKHINNAQFGPYYLQNLAESIDSIGVKKDDSWVKVKR